MGLCWFRLKHTLSGPTGAARSSSLRPEPEGEPHGGAVGRAPHGEPAMHLASTSYVSNAPTTGCPTAPRPRSAVVWILPLLALVFSVAGSVPSAQANDLSDSPCTAEDVEIIGSGIVINEPCTCPPGGTFTATVQFTVRNNTSTNRYCIALHLVPDGAVLNTPTDVVLKDASGKSTAPGKSGGEKFHDT